MAITVSGLGSGLNYDSWITELVSIKQADIDKVSAKVNATKSKESTLSTLEGDYADLSKAIKTFTEALSSNDVFNQKSVTSSNDAVTATVNTDSKPQDVSVSVSQLATPTTAVSNSVVASYITPSNNLNDISEGAMTSGTFSVYVNGTKHTININAGGSVMQLLALNDIQGVNISMSNDSKLTIKSTNTATYNVTVGSSSDTSNFSKVAALTRNAAGDYTSSKSLFTTDTREALTSASFANGSVTTGNFTIGNTEFNIDSTTTLDSIIDKINKSDCGATALWNSNTGKLELTATDEGATNINILAGDGISGHGPASNFTDVMGFTTSSIVDEGLSIGNLNETYLLNGSQTLGTNAVFTINGTTMTSASNKVTSDVSGINGLTLTLNDKTTSDATVSITQDTSKVVGAVTNLVSAYNKAICATDDATVTDGDLYGETILKSLRNSVRKLVTASISGDSGYNTLASIGITTGAIGSSTSSDTTQLDLDTDALIKAVQNNSGAVEKLLIGNGTTDGVLDKIQTVVSNATNSTNGYFTTRGTSYEHDVKSSNDKIDKMTTSLGKYKTMLEDKFAAMDKFISNMQNSASVFDSYFNSSSSSK